MTTVEFKELDTPEGKKYSLSFPKIFEEGFIKLGKVEGVFPRNYLTYYDRIKTFEIKDDDIWVVTFAKSGTTWAQEMVWCIMNDLDFKRAELDLSLRFPYFEMSANRSTRLTSEFKNKIAEESETKNINQEPTGTPGTAPNTIDKDGKPNQGFFLDSFDLAENLESPRFVKSHLHFSLLPTQLIEGSTKAKLIYVARSPKDVCVSFYHHARLLDGYSGTLEDFVEQFITDNVFQTPYWPHVRQFFEQKHRDDILFLQFEEMKKDLPAVILRTASFLGKSMTFEEVERLAKHLSFESMKNNQAVNFDYIVEGQRKIHGQVHDYSFMRKGQVGSWKDDLSPELVARLDQWIEDNQIQGL